MKKIIYSLSFCLTAFFLCSYQSGVFNADYTGTTGLGQSCSQIGCHTGVGTLSADTSKLTVKVLDANNVDVNSYTLNQQYTVEIKFRLDGATKVGFQCTNLFMFANNKAGVVANTIMPGNVQIFTDGSGREYMSHTLTGTGAAVMNGGYATWKYKWTAPSTAPNAISFNCIVNRTDNSNDEKGDTLFLPIMKILQLPTGVSNLAKSNSIELYPNPAMNSLNIKSSAADINSYSIIDLSGRTVLKGVYQNNQIIDIEKLNTGNYIISLHSQTNTYTKLFTVSKKL